MLFYYHIKILCRLVLVTFFTLSCAYFNTFYNAQDAFKNAKTIIDNKKYTETDIPIEAKKFLDDAIINSKVVLQNYPDSRWVEEAYYILAVSSLLKEDYKGSKEYFSILLDTYPKSKYYIESILWLSFCEYRLDRVDSYKNYISKLIDNGKKLNRYQNYIYNQILAKVSIDKNNTQDVYKYLNLCLKYSSSDSEKINIFNQFINYSENIDDYITLVDNLEKLYDTLEDDRDKKNVKLTALEFHKINKNYTYLITEIERLLNLSSFNNKRLFLNLELGKIYYQMNDYSSAKQIFYNLTSDNSKKKETAEAFYLLAKINIEESFDFSITKELLEKSKNEKSSSKAGKLAKKTLTKIEDLEDLIYEYNLSTNIDSSENNELLRADSLLFYIAESFYFDFNKIDSSIFRYKELIKKYPNSNPFAAMSLYALNGIDPSNNFIDTPESSWLDIAKQKFPNYSIDNISSQEYIDKLLPMLDLVNSYNLTDAYIILDEILNNDVELSFYKGLFNEIYFYNTDEMLINYINYANTDSDKRNLDTVKEKLSSYYYIINEDIKSIKTEAKLSDCCDKIINNYDLDSIYFCFEEINDIDDYYSYDSVKVRIDEIIPGSPSSFKRNMSHFDILYNNFQSKFSFIRDNIVVDSIYSPNSFSDSLKKIIQNSIITYEQNNNNPSSKIIDLDRYLNRYESLNFVDTSDKDVKISKEKDIMKFEDLNFENLELEKLKLNLTK
ncbi:MAG: hypothetical protein CBD21_03005 [bacterium TMED161]|nr:MAG: hypothetical protein CBD21_03005 [bacterium TMED161]|tara:strand:+ start:15252 stop:17426 length:2175 start_codon:yes stop_codon:yes gene_type:complete